MPYKYIQVSQLYAKTPFEPCHIHFLIKPKPQRQPTPTALPFTPRPLSASPSQRLQLEYRPQQLHQLALYVIGVSDENRVANLGHIVLALDETHWQKKEYLKGIVEQNGFLIYSTRDQPFSHQESQIVEEAIGSSCAVEGECFSSQYDVKRNQQCLGGTMPHQQSPIHQLSQSVSDQSCSLKAGNSEKVDQAKSQLNLAQNLSLAATQQQSSQPSPHLPSKDIEPPDSNALVSLALNESHQNAMNVLWSHKVKNSQYKQQLDKLQQQISRQQERIKVLGSDYL